MNRTSCFVHFDQTRGSNCLTHLSLRKVWRQCEGISWSASGVIFITPLSYIWFTFKKRPYIMFIVIFPFKLLEAYKMSSDEDSSTQESNFLRKGSIEESQRMVRFWLIFVCFKRISRHILFSPFQSKRGFVRQPSVFEMWPHLSTKGWYVCSHCGVFECTEKIFQRHLESAQHKARRAR